MSYEEQRRTNWLLEKQNKLIESMMAQLGMTLPPEPPPLKLIKRGPR